MTIILSHSSYCGTEWIAKIVGRDEKYTFQREFLNVLKKKRSCSGKTGDTWYLVEDDGVYEVNNAAGHERYFFELKNGKEKIIDVDRVLAMFPRE